MQNIKICFLHIFRWNIWIVTRSARNAILLFFSPQVKINLERSSWAMFAKTLPYSPQSWFWIYVCLQHLQIVALCLAEESQATLPSTPRREKGFGLAFGVVIWFIPWVLAVESPLHLLWGTTLPSVLSDTHRFRLSHSRDRQCSIPLLDSELDTSGKQRFHPSQKVKEVSG